MMVETLFERLLVKLAGLQPFLPLCGPLFSCHGRANNLLDNDFRRVQLDFVNSDTRHDIFIWPSGARAHLS